MPRQQLNNRDRIFGLDLMRAVAILMVLFAHCIWIFPAETGLFSQILALFGFFGVEIFFVLSGFLIGRILFRLYTDNDFNLKSIGYFLKRRWYRTFPNYFLVLLVNLLLAFIIGYQVEYGWAYFFFLQNFASTMPAFFPESWSLSVEEFAYIFLPFTLLLFAFITAPKYKTRIFLVATFMLIGLSIFAKIIYHYNTPNFSLDQWNLSLKAVVIYRLDSIFIGVFFSWIYSMYVDFWKRTKMTWFFLGTMMIGFFTFGVGYLQLTIEKYPFFWNVIYLPAASVSIAFFLPMLSEWKSEKSLIRKPVTFISLISYSIYLLHYGVILQSLKHLFNTENMQTATVTIFTIGYLTLTIFLSYILYRFYERPMMDKREKRASKVLSTAK